MPDSDVQPASQEVLTPELRDTLLRRQDALQTQAQTVIHDLAIVKLLAQAGRVQQHGSSVYGLMVWRDIDFAVFTHAISLQRIYEILLPLFLNPHMQRVRYVNEGGLFCPDDPTQERYYFGLYYRDEQGEEWKFDISFWLRGDEHQEPMHDSIMQQLTPESRIAILWIKDTWYQLPAYRDTVYSTDIYDAVLAHHVRTPVEFDQYLQEHGKPTRTEPST